MSDRQDFVAAAITALQEMFEQAGFTRLQISEEPWPPSLVQFLKRDADPQDLDDVYFRIKSDQGEFGVLGVDGPQPLLDLYGTGVRVSELYPYWDMLPDDLTVCPTVFDQEQLLRLWQQLVNPANRAGR